MVTPTPAAGAGRPLPQSARPSGPPPFDLTGGHFALSLLAFGIGSLLLPFTAPELAMGDPFAPRTLALVHLFALGMLGSAVTGALHQFYPMALGVPLRSVRVGRLGLLAWGLGLAALITGLWRWAPALMAVGWVLIVAAVGCVSWNLLPARRRTQVPDGKRIGAYVTAGHSALGIVLAIAALRIGSALGWWGGDRLSLLAVHFHMGVVGFGTLTAIGVGSRMLPMFLLTGPSPSQPLRVIGPAIVAGLLVQGAGILGGWTVATLLGSGILLAAALVTSLLLVRWWTQRHRPLEGGLELLPTATLWLLVAAGLGSALLFGAPRSFRLWEAYAAVALLGWLVHLVLAVLLRIVPHLSYIHLFGRRGVPVPLEEVVHRGWARGAAIVLPIGLLVLVVGILAGRGPVALAGAVLWAVGALFALAVFVRMLILAVLTPAEVVRP
jgi:hypothetical protein